jgi:membrane associated rhomboid family serine protease
MIVRLWGRCLRSGLEALIRLVESLGAGGTRWEWRKQAWRQAVDRRVAAWENLERGVRSPMKMCPSCRALVPRRERVCPECSGSLRGVPGGGIARLLSLALPDLASVTLAIVTVNVGMSLAIFVSWSAGGDASIVHAIFASPASRVLHLFGAKWARDILAGEVWRLVTANYLHAGFIHLFVNCYSLVNLGPLVEESFGARKFFLIYSATGVAAFATSTILTPSSLSVGASGSLFGLLGFIIVYGRFKGGKMGRAISDHLMQYLILGLFMMLIPGIDNAAHLGGAVAGAILGLVVDSGAPRTRSGVLALNLLTAGAILATTGSFLAMVLSYGERLQALGLR